jgi:hypothetical protein
VYLKSAVIPDVERLASSRSLWREISTRAGDVCVENLQRDLRYGLNYYSGTPLPDCATQPKPWRITQPPGATPRVTQALDNH